MYGDESTGEVASEGSFLGVEDHARRAHDGNEDACDDCFIKVLVPSLGPGLEGICKANDADGDDGLAPD